MATISFYSGSNHIDNLGGSGLGGYGNGGYGYSISVGSYQDNTFITNGAGTTQGPQCNNIKYLNSASGIINSAASGVSLLAIPNYLATLKISFTHTSAVKTQNCKLICYDRNDSTRPPSGVTAKFAQIIHGDTNQTVSGSGTAAWETPTGSSVIMTFAPSPGASSMYINGPSTTSDQHDFYTAFTCSPNSIGSKTDFGLIFQLEYL